MFRRLLAPLVAAIIATLAFAPTASGSTSHQTEEVFWHGQQAQVGTVDGARASLVRRDKGLAFQMHTRGLTPGNAYTMWLIVVNDPGECSSQPCSPPDVILNPATDSQILYAAGSVAGGSGKGTFAGSAKVGPLEGWLEDRGLIDPSGAEVHLIINDHGPKVKGQVADMIHTYRGGCTDDSLPRLFVEYTNAAEDGIAGPNQCRLFQAAVFDGS